MLSTAIAITVIHCSSPPSTEDRAQSLRRQYRELLIGANEPKFDSEPSVASPFSPGKLDPQHLEEGLNFLNFIRSLAGVPSVALDPQLTVLSQEAAMVMAAAQQLSHSPPQPAGLPAAIYTRASGTLGRSNLSHRLPKETLRSAIRGQFLDDDEANMASLGHRRWLLNPFMRITGMGLALSRDGQSSYTSIFAFDQSREGVFAKPYIAWPPEDHMPVDLMSARMPWSISINEDVCLRPVDGEITVTLQGKGRSWEFRPTSSSPASPVAAFARLDFRKFGIPNCIVFRPEVGVPWEPGDTYTVEVNGIKRASGSPLPIRFSGTFIRLLD